jgi:glutamine---fructose-6-phosphate transaminase (isomerizing)
VSELGDDFPELRDGPPWVTEEMVAAQPALVRDLLDAPPDGVTAVTAAIGDAQRAGDPITVIGCGTSEHGAMAIAALLAEALGGDAWPPSVVSRQSLDAVEGPQRGGVCIAVSHDGGTRATTLALEAAAAGGAVTALITARPDGAAAGPAAHVVTTPGHDDSWCHTVAYTSAIATGAALARELGAEGIDGAGAEALLTAGFASHRDAAPLAGAQRVVCAGAGIDLITARELALKLAEGARVPTAALHLETLLHGHLAGEDARTTAVLVHTDASAARLERRAALASDALAAIGMPVVTILPHDAPAADGLSVPLARLLGGAAALQSLTLALVRARGVNPDLIRREEEPYRRAGELGDGAGDW